MTNRVLQVNLANNKEGVNRCVLSTARMIHPCQTQTTHPNPQTRSFSSSAMMGLNVSNACSVVGSPCLYFATMSDCTMTVRFAALGVVQSNAFLHLKMQDAGQWNEKQT